MSPLVRRRIRPDGRGSYDVRLPRQERELLERLPTELEALLDTFEAAPVSDPVPTSLSRLLPVAHPRAEREEAAYVELARGELLRHHREVLRTLRHTAGATKLSPEELEAWLSALNDLRLVLGTAIGVTEEQFEPDEGSPDFHQWVFYGYLSVLASEVVDVLSSNLPPPRPGADDEVPDDPWGEPLGDLRWDGTQRP